MQAAEKKQATQSDSFLKLRRRIQNQMMKENVTYEEIVKCTKKIKHDQNK